MTRRLAPDELYPRGVPGVETRWLALRDGLPVRVVESGPRDAPPVVCLHGWGCSAYLFRHNIPALVQAGYRVLVPDLKGHGRTHAPTRRGEYTLASLTTHVLNVMDALELPRATVVGQSMGSRLALELAINHGARVDRLVLFAPVGMASVRDVMLLRPFPRAAWPLAVLLARRSLVRLALRAVYGTDARPTDEDVDQYWSPLDANRVHALYAIVHEMEWGVVSRAALARIVAPTLVVSGDEDILLGTRVLPSESDAIPNGRLVWVAGAGHVPNAEQPALSNALLVEHCGGARR